MDTRSDTRCKISGDDLRSAASSRSPSSVWCAGGLRNPTPGRDLSRMARLEIDAHHRLVHSTRLGPSLHLHLLGHLVEPIPKQKENSLLCLEYRPLLGVNLEHSLGFRSPVDGIGSEQGERFEKLRLFVPFVKW